MKRILIAGLIAAAVVIGSVGFALLLLFALLPHALLRGLGRRGFFLKHDNGWTVHAPPEALQRDTRGRREVRDGQAAPSL